MIQRFTIVGERPVSPDALVEGVVTWSAGDHNPLGEVAARLSSTNPGALIATGNEGVISRLQGPGTAFTLARDVDRAIVQGNSLLASAGIGDRSDMWVPDKARDEIVTDITHGRYGLFALRGFELDDVRHQIQAIATSEQRGHEGR